MTRRAEKDAAPATTRELAEPGMLVTRRGRKGQVNRSSLDEPSPSVTAYGISDAAAHQALIVENSLSPRTRTARPDPDQPLATLTANGLGNVKHSQVDASAIGGELISRGRRVSVDEPSPTVLTHGRASTQSELLLSGSVASVEPKPDRPSYLVPSMQEIAAGVGRAGLSIVSTFSGCGGSCLGFEMAGYRVEWASEFVPAAAAVYRANHPGVELDERSIRDVDFDALAARLGTVDVLEGSPPCASFSMAGRRSAHWGEEKAYSDTTQRTDDLFDEYVRALRSLQPLTFVAENVAGLTRGVAVGYFKRIHAAMVESGYCVEARMLDAQWLGVPQRRQRVIFVGVRDDLKRDPVFPTPLAYRYSVRDAIGELYSIAETAKVANRDDVGDHVAPTIEGYAIEREWRKIGQGGTSDRYLNLARAHHERPSPTVTAAGGGAMGAAGGVASVAHPSEPRKFTIAELKRLCSFPDDFELSGTYAQQWERLGRAVPPLMMRAVAETIRDEILCR